MNDPAIKVNLEVKLIRNFESAFIEVNQVGNGIFRTNWVRIGNQMCSGMGTTPDKAIQMVKYWYKSL